jgi:Restriction endonuclease
MAPLQRLNGLGGSVSQLFQLRGAKALVQFMDHIDEAPDSQRARFLLLAVYLGAIVVGIGMFAISMRRRRRTTPVEHRELLDFAPQQLQSNVGGMLQELGYRNVTPVVDSEDDASHFQCRDAQDRPVVVKCAPETAEAFVSLSDMQAFVDRLAMDPQAARGLFVTSSDFASPAAQLAREHNIELIDGLTLSRRMQP